ncbi:MAG: hypothetical protein JW838_01390 [Spirochaetes bacterium]|nr:hypothetical protein [Spirochaetota bacterium]
MHKGSSPVRYAFVLAGIVASPRPDLDIDLRFNDGIAIPGIESPGPDYTIMGGLMSPM